MPLDQNWSGMYISCVCNERWWMCRGEVSLSGWLHISLLIGKVFSLSVFSQIKPYDKGQLPVLSVVNLVSNTALTVCSTIISVFCFAWINIRPIIILVVYFALLVYPSGKKKKHDVV